MMGFWNQRIGQLLLHHYWSFTEGRFKVIISYACLNNQTDMPDPIDAVNGPDVCVYLCSVFGYLSDYYDSILYLDFNMVKEHQMDCTVKNEFFSLFFSFRVETV